MFDLFINDFYSTPLPIMVMKVSVFFIITMLLGGNREMNGREITALILAGVATVL